MSKYSPKWERNEGYCGCLTAYKGSLAIVICEAGVAGDTNEIQVFDEDNEEAMEYGETVCRIELPAWIEVEDAILAAEQLFF